MVRKSRYLGVVMRGRDFERWIDRTGLPRKAIAMELDISHTTISRLVRYRGPIPHRYVVAIRYWEQFGGDDPVLTPEEIRRLWDAPPWRLAAGIGMHVEHLYRVLNGRHPIKKVTSMAIRQVIRDYYGQALHDSGAVAADQEATVLDERAPGSGVGCEQEQCAEVPGWGAHPQGGGAGNAVLG